MVGNLYVQAAMGVITTLQSWIGVHAPERTEPLTWPEVLSNIDHLANDEHNTDAITMLITDYFAGDDSKAVRVARCESELNPKAYNRAGPYVGLFQIEQGPTDARTNVAQAREMQLARGWQPWPICGKS